MGLAFRSLYNTRSDFFVQTHEHYHWTIIHHHVLSNKRLTDTVVVKYLCDKAVASISSISSHLSFSKVGSSISWCFCVSFLPLLFTHLFKCQQQTQSAERHEKLNLRVAFCPGTTILMLHAILFSSFIERYWNWVLAIYIKSLLFPLHRNRYYLMAINFRSSPHGNVQDFFLVRILFLCISFWEKNFGIASTRKL